MAQYDPIAIKSGIPSVLGSDTMRADRGAYAGLTTTGLSSGDVIQVTANLTLSRAVNTSTSPIVGVYEGNSGSIVREGVVVASFKSGLTLANGDSVYLANEAGKLTNVKPSYAVIHEVGVIIDSSTSKILLQQKPCIDTGIPNPLTKFFFAGGGANTPDLRVHAYDMALGTWTQLASLPEDKEDPGFMGSGGAAMHYLPAQRKLVWAGCMPEFTTQRQNDHLLVYDIASNSWSTFTHTTNYNRANGGVITERGRYLIPAGSVTDQPTIYNPATNTVSSAASCSVRLTTCVVCNLADGRAAVRSPSYSSNILIFTDNGGSGSWSTGAATAHAHYAGAMVRLNDGRIMVLGGSTTTTCELNTPTCDAAWGAGASIRGGDGGYPGACVLPDGRVVCVSGATVSRKNLDIYTPGAWSPGQAPALNPGTWSTAASVLPIVYRSLTMFYSTASGVGRLYLLTRPYNDYSTNIHVWNPVADSFSYIVPPTYSQQRVLSCTF